MRSRPACLLLLLASLSAGAAGPEVRQTLTPDPDQPPPVEGTDRPVVDGTPHAWGLAADAVLTEETEKSHRLLAAQYLDDDAREYATSMLREWWGVNNRDDLLRVLGNLENIGQRARFEQMGRSLDSVPEFLVPLFFAVSNALSNDGHRLAVVHDHYRKLGSKSLLGWDLMRFIDVNRKGYAAGYITEPEAWANIMRASRRLQSTFGSWSELGDNYLLGRNFWSESEYQRRLQWSTDARDRLLHDAQSPWVVNAWNMNLDPSQPPVAKAAAAQATSGGSGTPGD